MTKVAVGFCHRSDSTKPQFMHCKTTLLVRDAVRSRRIVGEFRHESSANISAARCQIVREFLEHRDRPDWLWMVDDDMTFPVTILDRLLSSADAEQRPIVGGLCFGVRPVKFDGKERFNDCMASPLELFPTIYRLGEDGRLYHWAMYKPNTVEQVHSTGAACLLVHRRVLADRRWIEDGHPFPWFRESVLHGKPCSEDQFFCLRAGKLGFPVFIDTGAKTGHVKVFVADEDMFLAQQSARGVTLAQTTPSMLSPSSPPQPFRFVEAS